jgi:hypothetical protein
MKRLLQYD